MNKKDAELSPLARQLLQSSGAQQFFTQKEFDEALALAQAEIMATAIEASRTAVMIEREECAKIAAGIEFDRWDRVNNPDEKHFKSEIAEAIRNRIPTQRLQ